MKLSMTKEGLMDLMHVGQLLWDLKAFLRITRLNGNQIIFAA